jgi:hypothetical protein
MSNSQGIDFCLSLKFGMSLSIVARKLDHLHADIESSLMMHNLYESFNPENNKTYFDGNKERLTQRLHDQITDINSLIRFNNKFIAFIPLKQRIVVLSWKTFREVINERFENKLRDQKSQELANENLRLKLQQLVQFTQKSVTDFISHLDEEKRFEKIKSIGKKYVNGVDESIDLFSCGFYNISIFIMGKTIESVINDLLKKLIKTRKIENLNLDEVKYKDKIGILKGSKLINEKLFLDLNVVRIDRNYIGHPSRKNFSRNENKIAISKGLLLINELQKKL